jgi:uncharacterized membrane protein YphA (DoxX/SURF4 family)
MSTATTNSQRTPETTAESGPVTSPPKSNSVFVAIVRILLGALFVFAAVMKLQNPQMFAFGVKAFKFGLPDELTVFTTFVIPWTELVAGLALLLGIWARSAALIISLLLIAFLGGIFSVLIRGLDVSCACFGKFERPCEGNIGLCHIVRNCVLLAMGLTCLLKGPGRWSVQRPT